jgi:hypothetical protein
VEGRVLRGLAPVSSSRVITLTDALLRGGATNLAHVRSKLTDLAIRTHTSTTTRRDLADATRTVLVLGAADILLTDLIDLLTPDGPPSCSRCPSPAPT